MISRRAPAGYRNSPLVQRFVGDQDQRPQLVTIDVLHRQDGRFAVEHQGLSGRGRNLGHGLLVIQVDRDALGRILDSRDVIHPGEKTEVAVDAFPLKFHDWQDFRLTSMLSDLSQEGLGTTQKPGRRLFPKSDVKEPDLVLRLLMEPLNHAPNALGSQVAQDQQSGQDQSAGQNDTRDIELSFGTDEIEPPKPRSWVRVLDHSVEPPILRGDSRSFAVRHHPGSSKAAQQSSRAATDRPRARKVSAQKGANATGSEGLQTPRRQNTWALHV